MVARESIKEVVNRHLSKHLRWPLWTLCARTVSHERTLGA